MVPSETSGEGGRVWVVGPGVALWLAAVQLSYVKTSRNGVSKDLAFVVRWGRLIRNCVVEESITKIPGPGLT